MPLTVYDASVPVFRRALATLTAILDKAEAHVAERQLDPSVLLQARLHEGMFPFVRQVQIATDHAKGAAARLSASESPRYVDDEGSFGELKTRIAKTIDFIMSIPVDGFEDAADRPILLKLGASQLEFQGKSYLLTFALPNFFFHVTTAYDILRHRDVAIGKSDFLGEIG